MTELRQVCSHFMSGNCKYGHSCTKIHITPTTEILQYIEEKGYSICNFYPHCKFTSNECKKLHIDSDYLHDKDINEFKKIYLKIINFETTNSHKLVQVERIKSMIKSDIELMKDTLICLSECN